MMKTYLGFRILVKATGAKNTFRSIGRAIITTLPILAKCTFLAVFSESPGRTNRTTSGPRRTTSGSS